MHRCIMVEVRVLLVSETYKPDLNGAAVQVERHAHRLLKSGHAVSIYANSGSMYGGLKEAKLNGITVFREPSARLLLYPSVRVAFAPWIRALIVLLKTKPDIIHIHSTGLLSLAVAGWAKILGIPCIMTNHLLPENIIMNMPTWLRRPMAVSLLWLVGRLYYRLYGEIISPSQYGADRLKAHKVGSRHEVITNGVNNEQYKPSRIKRLFINSAKPTALYLGRLDGEKCVKHLLQSAQFCPNVKFIIAGAGNTKQSLEDWARNEGLKNVKFMGFVDTKTKHRLMQSADFFVLPSPAELQSLVTLEAMSSGQAIIVTNQGAVSELCHHGVNGFVFEHGNIKQMSTYINLLSSDVELRTSMGQASRVLINTRHSARVSLRKHVITYQRLITSRRPNVVNTMLYLGFLFWYKNGNRVRETLLS